MRTADGRMNGDGRKGWVGRKGWDGMENGEGIGSYSGEPTGEDNGRKPEENRNERWLLKLIQYLLEHSFKRPLIRLCHLLAPLHRFIMGNSWKESVSWNIKWKGNLSSGPNVF